MNTKFNWFLGVLLIWSFALGHTNASAKNSSVGSISFPVDPVLNPFAKHINQSDITRFKSLLAFGKTRKISTHKNLRHLLIGYMLNNPSFFPERVNLFVGDRISVKNKPAKRINRKAFLSSQNNRPKIYFRLIKQIDSSKITVGLQPITNSYLSFKNDLVKPTNLLSRLTIQRI